MYPRLVRTYCVAKDDAELVALLHLLECLRLAPLCLMSLLQVVVGDR